MRSKVYLVVAGADYSAYPKPQLAKACLIARVLNRGCFVFVERPWENA